MKTPSKLVKIFIAYSRLDEEYLSKLKNYLKPLEYNKDIQIWDDGEIVAGAKWEQEIEDNLYAADIILLLVSDNSFASDYFYGKEMADALARHEEGKAVVIPIILKPYPWDFTRLKPLQALPKNGKPINTWEYPSLAYDNIVRELSKSIKLVKKKYGNKLQIEQRVSKEHKRLTFFKQSLLKADKASLNQNWKKTLSAYNQSLKLYQKGDIPSKEVLLAKIKIAEKEQRKKRFTFPIIEFITVNWFIPVFLLTLILLLLLGISNLGWKSENNGEMSKVEDLIVGNDTPFFKEESKEKIDSLFCYNRFIEQAREDFDRKFLEQSLKYIDSALLYKPNDEEALVLKEEGEGKQEKEYNRLVNLADKYYNQKKWIKAKNYYEQAVQYKKTKHVQSKIDGINWRLKQSMVTKKTKQNDIVYDTIHYDNGTYSLIPRKIIKKTKQNDIVYDTIYYDNGTYSLIPREFNVLNSPQ